LEWCTILFSTFIIWPKVSSNIQITNLLEIFLASRYFQSAQNVWAKMKIFFNLYEVPEVIVYIYFSQNAKKFQALRFF
jgi:hypothetical protein